jgi:glutamine amidotransferase
VSEFLAIHLSDSALLPCAVAARASRVRLGDGELSAGVGFFQNDDLLLRKRPLPAGVPAAPERLAEGVESRAALICAGSLVAPSAAPRAFRGFQEEETLPLRFRRWLFAIAGRAEELTPAREALRACLPDSLAHGARGESAAEYLFLLFLARLREQGRLDDLEVEAPVAARALAWAVGEAERALEAKGVARPPLAAVVSNGRVLAALRRGHPLATSALDGLPDCARHEVSAALDGGHPLARSHRALEARYLLSGAAADGFQPVPEGGIVALGRDLVLRLQ